MSLDDEYEQIISGRLTGKPVIMSPDELDDFGGYLAVNHCDDRSKQQTRGTEFQKVQHRLDKYTDEDVRRSAGHPGCIQPGHFPRAS
jgi:hypothetical protein